MTKKPKAGVLKTKGKSAKKQMKAIKRDGRAKMVDQKVSKKRTKQM